MECAWAMTEPASSTAAAVGPVRGGFLYRVPNVQMAVDAAAATTAPDSSSHDAIKHVVAAAGSSSQSAVLLIEADDVLLAQQQANATVAAADDDMANRDQSHGGTGISRRARALLLTSSSSSANDMAVTPVSGAFAAAVLRHVNMTNRKSHGVYFASILGIYDLPMGPHIGVITSDAVAGVFPSTANVYRVHGAEFVAIGETTSAASAEVVYNQRRFVALLQSFIDRRSLYFSFDYDLTQSAERIARLNADVRTRDLALHPRADARFFWNHHALAPFFDAQRMQQPHERHLLDAWMIPVMDGFVETTRPVEIDGAAFHICFVSRRGRGRQGTRFNVRGIDAAGNVANFVETEQVIVHAANTRVASHVQIRGSIPVFWQQSPNFKYCPRIQFTKNVDDSVRAAEKHVVRNRNLYGKSLVFVNLIDQKRDQLLLGRAFEEALASVRERLSNKSANSGVDEDVRFVWFDFHHQCRKMQWQNLSKLMDIVSSALDAQGVFEMDLISGKVLSTQSGVMRTNCMDNLDRTNVVQSLFARHAVLRVFGKLEQSPDVLASPYTLFENVFKNMWADNADAMSLLYSGTDALKTDFTRTGKRTFVGAMHDLRNSVRRYYLANFTDGDTQDSIDLFLGRFTCMGGSKSPNGGFAVAAPAPSPYRAREPMVLVRLLLLLFAFLVYLLTARCGKAKKSFNGRDFVNRPHLVQHHVKGLPVPTHIERRERKNV